MRGEESARCRVVASIILIGSTTPTPDDSAVMSMPTLGLNLRGLVRVDPMDGLRRRGA